MTREKAKLIASHVEGDDGHAVCIHSLRVLIEPDGDGWFAQGLEIDYAAGGDSIEDVKRRFEEGLRATIQENLREFRTLDHMMVPAPPEEWRRFARQSEKYAFQMVSFFRREDAPQNFPYESITYLEPRVAHG